MARLRFRRRAPTRPARNAAGGTGQHRQSARRIAAVDQGNNNDLFSRTDIFRRPCGSRFGPWCRGSSARRLPSDQPTLDYKRRAIPRQNRPDAPQSVPATSSASAGGTRRAQIITGHAAVVLAGRVAADAVTTLHERDRGEPIRPFPGQHRALTPDRAVLRRRGQRNTANASRASRPRIPSGLLEYRPGSAAAVARCRGHDREDRRGGPVPRGFRRRVERSGGRAVGPARIRTGLLTSSACGAGSPCGVTIGPNGACGGLIRSQLGSVLWTGVTQLTIVDCAGRNQRPDRPQ